MIRGYFKKNGIFMKAFVLVLFFFNMFGCVSYQNPLSMENCINTGMAMWKDSMFKVDNVKSESIQRKLVMERCAINESHN